MPIVIEDVEYLTPEEACKVLMIHRNTLDRYYMDCIRGKNNMPCITNPAAIKSKGIQFRFGSKPNYLLPKADIIDWFIKRTPRV